MESMTDLEAARFSGVGCRFEWSQDGDCRVARVTGDVDMSNAHQVVDSLLQLGDRSLVLDLTGVGFIDSTGLRALFDLEKRLAPRSLTLLVPEESRVDRLLDLTGLGGHFAVRRPA